MRVACNKKNTCYLNLRTQKLNSKTRFRVLSQKFLFDLNEVKATKKWEPSLGNCEGSAAGWLGQGSKWKTELERTEETNQGDLERMQWAGYRMATSRWKPPGGLTLWGRQILQHLSTLNGRVWVWKKEEHSRKSFFKVEWIGVEVRQRRKYLGPNTKKWSSYLPWQVSGSSYSVGDDWACLTINLFPPSNQICFPSTSSWEQGPCSWKPLHPRTLIGNAIRLSLIPTDCSCVLMAAGSHPPRWSGISFRIK